MIFSAGPSIWYIAPAGGPVILTTQTLITQLHAPNVQSAAFSFSSYLPLILSYQVEKKKEPQFASLSSSNHLLIDALRHPCLFTLAVQTSNVACIPRAANSPSSPHASPARCGGPTRQEGGVRSAAVLVLGVALHGTAGGTKAGRVTGMYPVPQPVVRYRQASCLPRPRSDTTVPRRDSRLKKLPRRNSRVYSISYKSRTQDLANKDH